MGLFTIMGYAVMLLVDQMISDHDSDSHSQDVKNDLVDNEIGDHMLKSESLKFQQENLITTDSTKNKRLFGTFANIDELNESGKEKIVNQTIFKHSMMLKSFRKQEYNQ